MMYTFLTFRQWYVGPTQLIAVFVVSNHGPKGYEHHAIEYQSSVPSLPTECVCRVEEHQHQQAHRCLLCEKFQQIHKV